MSELDHIRAIENDVATLKQQQIDTQRQIESLVTSINTLVTRHEFTPVKMIAYGMATAVMSSVMMAIMAKVLFQ